MAGIEFEPLSLRKIGGIEDSIPPMRIIIAACSDKNHNYSKEKFVAELGSVTQSPEDFRQLCDRALTNFQHMRRKPSSPVQRGRP